MKKVMMISNVSRGLFGFRKELIERLLKENCEVSILAADTGKVDELRKMGCKFTAVAMDSHGTNPLTELKLVNLYKKLISREQPDIALTYTIKPNIYAGMACASLHIPYIANITGLGTAVEKKSLYQKPMVLLYKYGLRKAQKVFFQNSENMAFMLRHKAVQGPYELIPGSGVNLERFCPLPYPQQETLDFAFISRITREKGIDQYLDAAKHFRKKYPQTRFHICGKCDATYEAVLQELHQAGIVIYHGRIDDIPGMHRISCCTVHPTYYPEGMSNVLLESCACARPIITTDRPGCREIVEDGVNGFVVRQKDSIDLIEKMERFLSLSWEQRRDMGLAGRAKVEREFDRNIVVEKYVREINAI